MPKNIKKTQKAQSHAKSTEMKKVTVERVTLQPIKSNERNMIEKMTITGKILTFHTNDKTVSAGSLEFNFLNLPEFKNYEFVNHYGELHALLHPEEKTDDLPSHIHILFKNTPEHISQSELQEFINLIQKYQHNTTARENNTKNNAFILELLKRTDPELVKPYPQRTINEVDQFLPDNLLAPSQLDICLPEPNTSAPLQLRYGSFFLSQDTYTKEIPDHKPSNNTTISLSLMLLFPASILLILILYALMKNDDNQNNAASKMNSKKPSK